MGRFRRIGPQAAICAAFAKVGRSANCSPGCPLYLRLLHVTLPQHRRTNERHAMSLNRGLYDPRFDHDACGVAFVARIAGGPAHEVVQSGLQALINLAHRGASGADPDSGDGAGILVQLPDEFMRRVAGTPLPAPGGYGVGVVFLPADPADRELCEQIVAEACADEGLRVLGWG